MKRFKKVFTKAVAFSLSAVMMSFSFQTLASAEGLNGEETGEVLIAEDEAVVPEETAEQDEEAAVEEAEETVDAEETVEAETEEASDAEDTDSQVTEDEAKEVSDNSEEQTEDDTEIENAEDSEAVEKTGEVLEESDAQIEELTEIQETTESDANDWNKDKTKYYIDGKLVKDQVMKVDGEWYAFDKKGIATKLNTTRAGWKTVEDREYYYNKSKDVFYTNAVKRIGDYLYGFGKNGVCYDNVDFVITGTDANKYPTDYFRAKRGGELYENEWYDSNPESPADNIRYYYGNGGWAARNLQTVDGKDRLFGEDGELLVYISKKIGKVWYITDGEGVYQKVDTSSSGWKSAGDAYYYYDKSKNEFVVNQIKQIGSKYYGFDAYGKMYSDEKFGFWDNGTYTRYIADKNGALISSKWWRDKPAGSKYNYVGSDMKVVEGPKILTLTENGEKVQYLLGEDGYLIVNEIQKVSKTLYVSDKNGKASKVLKGNWYKVGDYWYYAEANNKFAEGKIIKVGGKYYAFNYDGQLHVNELFEKYYYSDEYEEFEETKYYKADANGVLSVNKWEKVNDNWYYFGSDAAAYTGLNKINKKNYIFDYEGMLMTSCYTEYSGALYRADGTGEATKVTKPDGLFNGAYMDFAYYYSNGKKATKTWKTINGKKFYFNYEGNAVRQQSYTIGKKIYYFEEDGTLAGKGWHVCRADEFYYTDDSGVCSTGIKTIGEKKYIFDDYGLLLKGAFRYNGKNYITDDNGAVYKEVKDTGFVEDEYGRKYYVWPSSKEFIYDSVETINSKTYYFGYDGSIQCNCKEASQIFGNDGTRVESGWYQIGLTWYFIDDVTHQVTIGEKTIKGKTYYFNAAGEMVTNDSKEYGLNSFYDENGYLVKAETPNNGWYLYGGKYYYFKDSRVLYDTWVGEYYLDSHGVMLRNNKTPDGFYVGSDGKYVKNTVCNGYAVKANGKVAGKGWITISNKKYYTDDDGCVYGPAYRVIDGNLYQFDYNGALVKEVKSAVKDGWVQNGKEWVYIIRGEVCTGMVEIKGKNYYFDWDGCMLTNTMAMDYNGRMRYFGSDGAEDTTRSGWKEGYYYGQDNRTTEEWYNVKGKLYCGYSGYGDYTGYTVLYSYDNKPYLYEFNKDGSLKGVVKHEGWVKIDGQWFFFENGTPLQGGIYKVKGKFYAFLANGELCGEGVMGVYNFSKYEYDHYYIKSDGTLFTSGFKTIDGKQYYFDKNGKALVGVYKINGKIYYLDAPSDEYSVW